MLTTISDWDASEYLNSEEDCIAYLNAIFLREGTPSF